MVLNKFEQNINNKRTSVNSIILMEIKIDLSLIWGNIRNSKRRKGPRGQEEQWVVK